MFARARTTPRNRQAPQRKSAPHTEAISGGFCCQVPPNPACRSLSRQDFKYRYYKPLTRPALPEHSCRWQLWIGPLRRSHLGQKHVLYALVDPVSAPPKFTPEHELWWSRRVLPPGPIGLLRRPFIAIAGLAAGPLNIGAGRLRRKGEGVSREKVPRPEQDPRKNKRGAETFANRERRACGSDAKRLANDLPG